LDEIPLLRQNLFGQIHEIVFHGQGGYDYATVYNMPIWLRKFTFKKIKGWYDAANKDTKSEESWLKGEAKDEAAKNKEVTRPKFIKAGYKT
jgi:hypothetical protein